MLNRANAIFLKAFVVIKHKVGNSLDVRLVDHSFKLENNEAYLNQNIKNAKDNNKDDWLVEDFESKNSRKEVINSNASSNWAKEKLVQILKKEVPIPQL